MEVARQRIAVPRGPPVMLAMEIATMILIVQERSLVEQIIVDHTLSPILIVVKQSLLQVNITFKRKFENFTFWKNNYKYFPGNAGSPASYKYFPLSLSSKLSC